MKKALKPGNMLAPLPCVMVSVSDGKKNAEAGKTNGKTNDKANDNVITIAWTGIINSEPPMTYISVRPSRHSYNMLKSSMEFVINIPNEDMVFATDYCGCKSGANEDKFKAMHLTKLKADFVSAPLIAECPVNLECKVKEIKALGSHDMFIAEIVAVHVDEELLDENGRIAYEKAKLACYMHGEYYGVKSKRLGSFGFSVMKPKTAKRLRSEGKKVSKTKAHFEKKD